MKNKTTADSWFFRHRVMVDGKPVHCNQKIGTVRDYPRRKDAEQAVMALRAKINSEVRIPETVEDLVAHYLKHELTLQSDKRSSTREVYAGFIKLHIAPM